MTYSQQVAERQQALNDAAQAYAVALVEYHATSDASSAKSQRFAQMLAAHEHLNRCAAAVAGDQ